MVYVKIGDWLIKESIKTCWIYKSGICYARIPIRKHKNVKELKDLLEKFLLLMGLI